MSTTRTSIPGATSPAAPQSRSGAGILAATILGSSMAFIDSTVVNVALPVLQRDLRATSVDVQWVVEAYALFLSALILVGGSLGDRFGRRRIFTLGIALFAAASLWCGLAPTITQLIIARAVQGIGGALLTPGSLAIISATFPPATRGRAIGTWSGFTTLTSVIGPVLGGFLIQYSWRWIFFINLPLAALALFIALRFVPETRDEAEQGALDVSGAVLATVGLGALVFALITAGADGFAQARVVIPLVGGIAALALFIVVEARAQNPMMPLSVFRSRAFAGTNLMTLLLYGALGGALYFLPFNLQQVQGYTPLEAGASLLPFTVIMFSLSRWAGGLVARYGARLPLIVGPCLAGVGFLLFARTGIGGAYWTEYLPAIIALGLGMTITVSPLTTTVMGAVSQDRAGVASGVNNAVARSAGLLAVAVFGIVVTQVFYGVVTHNLAGLHLAPDVLQSMSAQRDKLLGATIPAGVSSATHHDIQASLNSAFIAGFRVAMVVGAALAFASAGITALFIHDEPSNAQ